MIVALWSDDEPITIPLAAGTDQPGAPHWTQVYDIPDALYVEWWDAITKLRDVNRRLQVFSEEHVFERRRADT